MHLQKFQHHQAFNLKLFFFLQQCSPRTANCTFNALFKNFIHVKKKTKKKRVGKPNGIVITEELRDELNAAAAATAQAYATVRNSLASGEEPVGVVNAMGYSLEDVIAEKLDRHKSGSGNAEREEGQLNSKVLVMQPILRFLQLLCENHNRELQVSH